MTRILIFFTMVFLGRFFVSGENLCEESADSLGNAVNEFEAVPMCKEDNVFSSLPWWKQVVESGFRIHDKRINYPAFPRFCLKIYDWGDKAFNTYDPEYVKGVGKNWKVVLKNYNWMTSYMMRFEGNHNLHIRSDIYPDVGAYICFMAVNVGYTAKLDNIFGNARKTRENFNVSFTTSRFHAVFNRWKTIGDTKITKFGDYKGGHSFQIPFDHIKMQSYNAELYYFFNNKKFSHAAAYCFSKYQLKTAGSWIAGLSFNHQTLDMDFSTLPKQMRDYIPALEDVYRFRFNDYSICGGYSINWVLRPKRWLLNAMLLPSVGYRYSYRDSSEGQRHMFAADVSGSMALVYNHKAFYGSANLMLNGHLYFNRNYTLFDSIESLSINVGCRF